MDNQDDEDVIYVETTPVFCDGGKGALGHSQPSISDRSSSVRNQGTTTLVTQTTADRAVTPYLELNMSPKSALYLVFSRAGGRPTLL